MKPETPPFVDLGQVINEIKQDEKKIFIKNKHVVMQWKEHGYAVSLDRIKDWAALCDWLLHLCGKGWITPHRLRMFAEIVIREKKWRRPDA